MTIHHARLILFVLAVLPCLSGSAAAEGKVTAVSGDVQLDGRPLAMHARVGPGQWLALDDGASASLLLPGDTLVNLCNHARADLTKVDEPGTTRIALASGDVRVLARAGAASPPLSIETPTARIDVLGTSAHVSVAAESGDTQVTSLQGRVRIALTTRTGAGPMLLERFERVTIRRGADPGSASRIVSAPPPNSSCGPHAQRAHSVAASSALLSSGLPPVSGVAEDAAVHPPDLAVIVAMDIPEDGIPLEGTSSPSALIVELGKAGLDEEVCDPITCNPVYQLPPPEICGVPPVAGCIPGM